MQRQDGVKVRSGLRGRIEWDNAQTDLRAVAHRNADVDFVHARSGCNGICRSGHTVTCMRTRFRSHDGVTRPIAGAGQRSVSILRGIP